MTNFEVQVGDKVFKGLCKAKDEAINDYDDAIASGHGAYLVEQGEQPYTFADVDLTSKRKIR